MGDDNITVIIPEQNTEEETTATEELIEESVEELGEELLSRLDEQSSVIGELNARITELERLLGELHERPDTDLSGLAPIGHSHEEYATREHLHTETKKTEKQPDKPPEKQHPYFRKIGE